MPWALALGGVRARPGGAVGVLRGGGNTANYYTGSRVTTATATTSKHRGKKNANKGMEREKRKRGEKGMTGFENQKNPGSGGMVPNYRYIHPVID